MTAPIELLTRDEGQQLLGLLTAWWLTGEGVVDGAHSTVDHSAQAIDERYGLSAFYRLLRESEYPVLADRDEHALDAVHRAFLGWAVGRPARRLAASESASVAARDQIRRAIVTSRDGLMDGVKRLGRGFASG